MRVLPHERCYDDMVNTPFTVYLVLPTLSSVTADESPVGPDLALSYTVLLFNFRL